MFKIFFKFENSKLYILFAREKMRDKDFKDLDDKLHNYNFELVSLFKMGEIECFFCRHLMYKEVYLSKNFFDEGLQFLAPPENLHIYDSLKKYFDDINNINFKANFEITSTSKHINSLLFGINDFELSNFEVSLFYDKIDCPERLGFMVA